MWPGADAIVQEGVLCAVRPARHRGFCGGPWGPGGIERTKPPPFCCTSSAQNPVARHTPYAANSVHFDGLLTELNLKPRGFALRLAGKRPTKKARGWVGFEPATGSVRYLIAVFRLAAIPRIQDSSLPNGRAICPSGIEHCAGRAWRFPGVSPIVLHKSVTWSRARREREREIFRSDRH